jgi:ATP-dependent helicase/nuclease subunit B
MRQQFGLPSGDRSIGQSAHDLYQLCAAPEVMLTRARKKDGAPTVPSRWLVRLETLVGGHDSALLASLHHELSYSSLLQLLDAPLPMKPLERPEPRPVLTARPRAMSVTAIDKWLADPYQIYAQYILKLRALKPLDKEPSAADFGEIVHEALEDFVRNNPHYFSANALEELLDYGRNAFAPMIDRPAVACLWWPRFESIAHWLIAQEQKRRGFITDIIVERNGIWELPTGDTHFTLTTRIDRLEIARDGAATVIDYKTGYVPERSKLDKGEANQLPLVALIAQYGQLQPPPERAVRVDKLEYWKLAGSEIKCQIMSYDAADYMHAAKERLQQLIAQFDDPNTAYGAQKNAPASSYNDYEHLTRRSEWEAV